MPQRRQAESSTERLLTPREAAEYLRLNPRTVTRLAREGKLPGTKIGQRWRFSAEALAAYSGGRTTGHPAPAVPSTSVRDFSIASLVRSETVIPDLKARRKEAALDEMVSHLAEAGFLDQPRLFLDLISEREELMSTNIAEGVAVPHPRRAVPGMFEESIVEVAISRRGVEFGGSEAAPVRVFFLICASDDRRHLMILGKLSRLLLATAVVDAILGAGSPDEVVEAIAAQERAIAEGTSLKAS